MTLENAPWWNPWARRSAMGDARELRREASAYQERIHRKDYPAIIAAEIEELKEVVALIDEQCGEHGLGRPID
jgi:hypothetical protein